MSANTFNPLAVAPAMPANVPNRVVSSGFRGLFRRLDVWS